MGSLIGYWLPIAVIVGGTMIGLGAAIKGGFFGILIDKRNKMSLSRLQLVMWTFLLVSSFLAVALAKKTANIEMDPQLWALLGISLGSFAGANIVTSVKHAKEPDAAKVDSVAMSATRSGVVHIQSASKKARFADMFKGEEITDYEYVDISKVQMFFFTIAAWLGYAYALWTDTFAVSDGLISFPSLSTSLVTLIGISHAGYLTVKATTSTPTKP